MTYLSQITNYLKLISCSYEKCFQWIPAFECCTQAFFQSYIPVFSYSESLILAIDINIV